MFVHYDHSGFCGGEIARVFRIVIEGALIGCGTFNASRSYNGYVRVPNDLTSGPLS
jgi:hypothetical protein